MKLATFGLATALALTSVSAFAQSGGAPSTGAATGSTPHRPGRRDRRSDILAQHERGRRDRGRQQPTQSLGQQLHQHLAERINDMGPTSPSGR